MTLEPRTIASICTQPALRVAVAALLLSAVLYCVDVGTVWRHLRAFDPATGILMLGANAALFALLAARWHNVARTLGIHAPYRRFLSATWIGAFVSQVGPALVLNEITRFRLLLPHARKWPLGVSQLFDRVSGQIVLAAIVLMLVPRYSTLFTAEVGHRIVLGIAFVLILGGALFALAHRFRHFIEVDASAPGRILNPIASPMHYTCSLGIQLLLMSNLALAAHGLGAAGYSIEVFLVAPLVLGALTLLPLSFADWGSREAAALLFLSTTGLTPEQIVSISLVYGGMNVLSVLPAGLLLFHTRLREQASRGA